MMQEKAKKIAFGFCKFGFKTSLRVVFGATTAVGAAFYHGLDPAHLTLQYGVGSALAGFGGVMALNGATIALVATLGAFAFTQMTLAGVKAYKRGGSLGYVFKKCSNAAVGVGAGAVSFLTAGVAGMEIASRVTRADMFAQPSLEDQSLVSTIWNNISGRNDGGAMSSHGPYDFAEISDAFEHFELAEMDGGDVVLGIGETFSQIQGTFLTGLEESLKEPAWNGFLTSPDFFASAIVAGSAIGAAILTFKYACKGLDYCTGATLKNKCGNSKDETRIEVADISTLKPPQLK